MNWPLSQEYNEAIPDPRNRFSDAELKAAEAVSNTLGIPMPRSGNFADVYDVRCPAGGRQTTPLPGSGSPRLDSELFGKNPSQPGVSRVKIDSGEVT